MVSAAHEREAPLLFLDGGTTHTRFTCVRAEQVLSHSEVRAGAGHAAPGQNAALREAVAVQIAALEAELGCALGGVYASGMIGSPSGLCEVPHIAAPAGLEELAAAIVPVRLPDVWAHGAICFVPGLKFAAGDGGVADMLRGEEAELMGALTEEDAHKRLAFVHFGSHNKLMLVENGRIARCVTTLSGELLWAAAHHTILRGSLAEPDGQPLDEEHVLLGCAEAARHGLTRALFATRIHQLLEGASTAQALAYLYGALTAADFAAYAALLAAPPDEWVLYGRDAFVQAFLACAPRLAPGLAQDRPVRVIPFAQSEGLSVLGMRRLCARREALGMKSGA